jgi:phage terminase large subunit-like protein
MKLVTLTSQDPRFYPLMGPFLANRDVVGYLGGHMWDDEAKTWTIAISGEGVRGFIATITAGRAVKAQSCYVADGEDSLTGDLIRAVIAAHAPSALTAVVRADHTGPWLAEGFVPVQDKGRFIHLARRGD